MGDSDLRAFPEPERSLILENDPLALEAALRSISTEGSISPDLTTWKVPCLVYAGEEDELYAHAARAAAEIPNATLVSLPGHSHFSAERVAGELPPRVLELFRSADR